MSANQSSTTPLPRSSFLLARFQRAGIHDMSRKLVRVTASCLSPVLDREHAGRGQCLVMSDLGESEESVCPRL